MSAETRAERIRVAIAGIGNCASALVHGIAHYRRDPSRHEGLLFPSLAGYRVGDIEIVAAFDVARAKVGRPLGEAIDQPPNNFTGIPGVRPDPGVIVQRAPTLDGNPPHLALLAPESTEPPVDVAAVLAERRVEVLLNLLPTGSLAATELYARAAIEAGCAFVNAIPTPLAQRADFQAQFAARGLPLFGDDIKSQMGTTILHRALLALLELRGSTLRKTTQVNIGGNTDFANFVHRAESKLVSKRKSLARFIRDGEVHVGHHYDPTRGPLKNAHIEIESTVFGGSPVKISVRLESDDKPNSAGSLVDLIRLARGARDRGLGGLIPEACAFYMKSPPVELLDGEALARLHRRWIGASREEGADAGALDSILGR